MNRLVGLISVAGLVFAVGCSQTDAGVTTAVKAKMAVDDTVKAYQINVDTQNHVVTLSGDVDTSAAKDRAVLIARETNGVNDVVDHIIIREIAATTGDRSFDDALKHDADQAGDAIADATRRGVNEVVAESKKGAEKTKEVARDTGTAIGDAAITGAVKTRFLADAAVKGLAIDVDTTGGVVTLSGTVTSAGEATRAVTLTQETIGVTRVINHLMIK